MKILVICQYYYPENFQITPICEQLVTDGYEVTVLTGLPNYPTGIIKNEYRKGHRDEYVNGVHVIRSYEIGRKKGVFSLALNYVSYCFSALRKVKMLAADFDLAFVYQLSPVLMGLPGRKYAKKYNVPLLLYCCDLWPESMKMYIKNENNIMFKIMKRVSKHIYSSCQCIIVQSSSFLSYLEKVHKIPKEKLIYVPAFANETSYDLGQKDDTVDFVFLGNLGIAQNLIAVLNAVKKIKNTPCFKVHFVGDGTCLNEMKQFVRENGLEDIVYFYGRRPAEEMPDFYKLADACLVSLKADCQIGLTLPTKVQGYMAAGKPIIGMIDGSANDIIKEVGCGICVAANDVEGFAKAMLNFIEHKEQYRICGEHGLSYFRENFSKTVVMKKLETIINRYSDN